MILPALKQKPVSTVSIRLFIIPVIKAPGSIKWPMAGIPFYMAMDWLPGQKSSQKLESFCNRWLSVTAKKIITISLPKPPMACWKRTGSVLKIPTIRLKPLPTESAVLKYAWLGSSICRIKIICFFEGTAREEYSSTLPPAKTIISTLH